jgi:hypothetical protein
MLSLSEGAGSVFILAVGRRMGVSRRNGEKEGCEGGNKECGCKAHCEGGRHSVSRVGGGGKERVGMEEGRRELGYICFVG